MLSILISWMLLFFIFYSFGDASILLCNKLTNRKENYSIVEKVLIGFCSIGVMLLYASIFMPLDIWVLLLTVVISIIYTIYRRHTLYSSSKNLIKKIREYSSLQKTIIFILSICLLIFPLGTPFPYDNGLYHLQTMEWAENYKAIVGLGNLHGRLAFNSSFLLLSTLFNYHPHHYTPFFSINSFCLLLFSLWILDKTFNTKNQLQQAIFSFILLIVIFVQGKDISSSTTDIFPGLIVLFLLTSWTLNTDYFKKRTLTLVLLPIFCITVKLSSLAIALIPLYFIIQSIIRREYKTTFTIILLGAIISLPWIVRFVILSGYLIYPFASVDIFNFDWKIPIEMVKHEQIAAYAWARIPNEDLAYVASLSFEEWFPVWLRNTSSSIYKIALYLLAIVSPLIILTNKRKQNLVPWIIAFMGVVFGFITAPDFRFTFGFIISAGIIPFLMINKEIKPKQHLAKSLYCAMIIALCFFCYMAVNHIRFFQEKGPKKSYLSLIIKPQSATLQQEVSNFSEYKINDIIIFIPQESNQCFDQQIPCAPYYNSNLELRGEDIKDGFRIKQ